MSGLSAPIKGSAVISVAASQIGVHEEPFGSNKQPYGAWYVMNGVAWCAIFVSWVMHHAGFDGFAITSKNGYSYCPDGVNFAKKNGFWLPASSVPSVGDIAFFDFPGDGVNRPSHTGIVERPRVSATQVGTIEGNTNPAGGRTGGEVMRHNRTAQGGLIGFLHINYLPESSTTPTPPLPPHSDTSVVDRVKRLQHAVGVTADGAFGPQTEAAVNRNLIGWKKNLAGNHNTALVKLLQEQGNRKYGDGLVVDGLLGPATNHLIVVQLGQSDGIAGPNAWRKAVQ